MNRKRLLLALSLILLLLVFRASALPIKTKYIQGFHVVKKLPLSMVAGETVEWQVSLVNAQSKNGLVNITLEIVEEHGIGFGEFMVEGALESYDNPHRKHYDSTLTFTEKIKNGIGIFQNQTSIKERFNNITLKISSVPNLMPGTYTFTLTVTLQY